MNKISKVILDTKIKSGVDNFTQNLENEITSLVNEIIDQIPASCDSSTQIDGITLSVKEMLRRKYINNTLKD